MSLLRQCRHVDFLAGRRCTKVTLTGLCLDHRMGEWSWRVGGGSVRLSVHLGNMNRPRLHVDECRPVSWASLDFGNGNSDPVWSLDWTSRRLRAELDNKDGEDQ